MWLPVEEQSCFHYSRKLHLYEIVPKTMFSFVKPSQLCHFAQLHLFVCVFSIPVISCQICWQREGPEAKAELC